MENPAASGASERDPALTPALEQAARFRVAALLLSLPGPEVASEVAEVASCLAEPVRAEVFAVSEAMRTARDLEADYHRLMGPGGACAAAESDHDPAACCNKGPLLADVRAFYKAFAFDEQAVARGEALDHVSTECAFMAYLHFKAAHALFVQDDEAASVTRQAIRSFRRDHLDPFLARFFPRLSDAARGHPVYERIAPLAQALAT